MTSHFAAITLTDFLAKAWLLDRDGNLMYQFNCLMAAFGHFRQMVNLAIIFKSLANGYNYGTIFKIHACINWNYIEYIIMIA